MTKAKSTDGAKTDDTATAKMPSRYILQYPFKTAEGKEIKSLALHRLTRGDMRNAMKHSEDNTDQETFLLARMCGLTLEDVDNIDLADSVNLVGSFRRMVGVKS